MKDTNKEDHTPISRIAVAPMLDWTDRHARFFLRQICHHIELYTEMITTPALLHGPRQQLLRFHAQEAPITLQLGGSDPNDLALCAKMAEDAGYQQVNLNVGCPSDRVQSMKIGACLMAEPELVAQCYAKMQETVSIPVSIKTRIGIDHCDDYSFLTTFIKTVSAVGCRRFILHARKAWLSGLSPKENREIPPLHYPTVYQLKKDCPTLQIMINGGIKTNDEIQTHLNHVDGVMIGREAYQNPYLLSSFDRLFWDKTAPQPSRKEIIERMLPYIENELSQHTPLSHITRHMLGLFHGQPGARAWRRHLSEHARHPDANVQTLHDACQYVL